MKTLDLKVKKFNQRAQLPVYGSEGAFCFDLHACLEGGAQSYVIVSPGTPATIPTGLAFEIPEGWGMLIFSRSGHGFKSDVRLANCVGVIDSDYRNEVMVKLTNDNNDGQFFTVRHGDRIAQAVIVPAPSVRFIPVDELSVTKRGMGGFGSTGR